MMRDYIFARRYTLWDIAAFALVANLVGEAPWYAVFAAILLWVAVGVIGEAKP